MPMRLVRKEVRLYSLVKDMRFRSSGQAHQICFKLEVNLRTKQFRLSLYSLVQDV